MLQFGTWSDINNEGLTVANKTFPYYTSEGTSVEGKTLKVVTVLANGFTMIKQERRALEGNDRYQGYVIDLIEELSRLRDFHYEIIIYSGKGYGSCNKTTMTCDGMLGEITSGRANMALVDLTITAQRAEVVDFTHPFINTGISILFKKIFKSEVDLFGFLAPFTKVVWVVVSLTILSISFMLHVIGRLSPYEWLNPYPCRQNEDIQENEFNVNNSSWFIFAALTQQGSEIAPR